MNSKRKGKAGELEFSRLAREHGYDCRRTAQYCGNTGDAADVVGLPGVHVEVKRVEHLDLTGAMSQAIRDARPEDVPIVAHRKNYGEWFVTMRAVEWFEFFKAWESR